MKRIFVLTALALAWAAPADAAIITFTNRVAFDAAFPGATIEDFDGFANGTVFPNGTTVNGITYNSSNGNALVTDVFIPSTSPNGLGQTVNGFFLGTDSITFTFDEPLSAFGIDINTFASTNGAYTATTSNGDVIGSFFDPFPGFGTGQFVGFSSTVPFTSVTIASPEGTPYTLDTLRFQVADIPEPATLAVFGLMAAGAFGVRRRKRVA